VGDESCASFGIVGNTLEIKGVLVMEDGPRLEAALRELGDTDFPTVVIDMSSVSRMSSRCVQPVMLSLVWLQQRGRRAVVRARQQPFQLLKQVGGEQFGALQLVDG
jgi:anti-anti-sigma regulatory factor